MSNRRRLKGIELTKRTYLIYQIFMIIDLCHIEQKKKKFNPLLKLELLYVLLLLYVFSLFSISNHQSANSLVRACVFFFVKSLEKRQNTNYL